MNSLKDQNFIQQLSIDCVIFGYEEKKLKVLVPKLYFEGDFWALPSGFIFQNEGIDQAARRIIEQRTGIDEMYLEQFRVFGDASRSNKEFLDRLQTLNDEKLGNLLGMKAEYDWITNRFVSIGYLALVDIRKVVPRKSEIDQSIDWFDIKEIPRLVIDLSLMVSKAVESLRLKFDENLIGCHLLPETFTMKELQELYETVFNKPFARNNFQKKILDMNILERLEKKFTGAANKAPFLYRLKKEK
jgi:ADP-ribose pyrophosphatase YjhB (NUDIX family)